MNELIVADKSDLVAIADAVRQLKGTSDGLTINEMKTNIDDAYADVTAALSALAEKGVDVPADSTIDALAGLIAGIESGGLNLISGSITPSSNTSYLTINHNLGRVPTFFAIWGKDYSTSNTTLGSLLCGMYFQEGYGVTSYGAGGKVYADQDENVNLTKPFEGSRVIEFVNATKADFNGYGKSAKMIGSYTYMWLAG